MDRRYLDVEGRRVLYRRCGDGPPLVLLHGSPGNSAMLADEMAVASPQFTCIALDTPGFGGSDPLPGDELTVADLADATAAAMRALGLPPCVVYGTHTGALIAAELGVRHPGQVSGLVMEGLPIFTPDEIAAIFTDDYFASLTTDVLGGHLVSTWMRFRDQFTWFPWRSREVARLNPVDRPTPAEIDLWVSMFYRSCGGYAPAYRAACFHGRRAYEAAATLTQPAVFMASAEDMLFPHLDRLPPMKPGQRIEALPHDPAAKHRAIADFARSLPQPSTSAPAPRVGPVGSDPAMQFVDVSGGQVLVRCYGDSTRSAFVLLHDAPGSGLALEEQARAFAAGRYVVVPDLPGCGESDDGDEDILAAAADAVLAVIDALGIDRAAIAAVGCGCAVAALLGRDPRVTMILLDGAPTPDPAVAAAIAPDLPLAAEGTHWLTAWLMVRDAQVYSPWFDGRVAAQRSAQGNFDPDWLHAQTVEIMKARTSYHRLPRAAWTHDSSPDLAAATVPVRTGPLSSLIGEPA